MAVLRSPGVGVGVGVSLALCWPQREVCHAWNLGKQSGSGLMDFWRLRTSTNTGTATRNWPPKLAFAAAINGKVVLAPKSFRAVTARGVCLPVQDVQDPGAAD